MGRSVHIASIVMLAACSGGGGGSSASWTAVAEAQPAALLSVWSGGASNVWVVGGNPADNSGPLVYHYDGTTWTKKSTGLTNLDLWWVKGFDDGTVMMSGSNGTILRYHSDTDTFETMATPAKGIVTFGLWGAAPNDMWAVGGAAGGGGQGFAWRFNGTSWSTEPSFPVDIETSGTCWKVNGLASNNVWMSGTNGLTLHWNGTTLERMDVADAMAQGASLFSIGVNSKLEIAVGGGTNGVLYENTGAGWNSAVPSGIENLAGVAVSETDAYAVGLAGTILHRGSDGKWATDKQSASFEDLHAAFIDPQGGVWAVGGQYEGHPTTDGVLLHKGAAVKPLQ